MNFFKQWRRFPDYATMLLVLGVAGGVRLFNLDRLGPFIDESGHIALATRYDYTPLFDRISQGKVLGYILFYPTARWASEPLVATRLLIALIGILTTFGVFLLAREFRGGWSAFLAGLIWALSPFVVMHDRLALHDPLVSSFFVWSSLLLIESVKNNRPWMSGASGLLFAFAILTKVYAVVYVFCLLFYAFVFLERRSTRWKRISVAFGLVIALPLTVTAIYAIPVLDLVLQGSQSYTAVFANGATLNLSKWNLLLSNFSNLTDWITGYDSIPFGVLLLLAVLLAMIRPSRNKIALLFSAVVPSIAFAFFFKVWFPRYFIPNLIPWTVLVAVVVPEWLSFLNTNAQHSVLSGVGNGFFAAFMFAMFGFSALDWISTDWVLQVAPHEAKIPAIDRYQYFDGWPSGTGVIESVSYLNALTRQSPSKILVITGGFGRHGFWSIPLFMRNNPKIEFRNIGITTEQDADEILALARNQSTLVLLEPPMVTISPVALPLLGPSLDLIFKYMRPNAEGGFLIYRVSQVSRDSQ